MTSADFTIKDVLAWARTKPADEFYPYTAAEGCAVCQFLKETGRAAKPVVGPYITEEYPASWCDGRGAAEKAFPKELDDAVAARGEGCSQEERWSFGALVRRLEKLCPETPVTASNWAAIDAYLSEIETVEA